MRARDKRPDRKSFEDLRFLRNFVGANRLSVATKRSKSKISPMQFRLSIF